MEKLELSEISDQKDRLSSEQRESFTDGFDAYKMQEGESLWRFVSVQKRKFSDCWIDSETMASIMRTFKSRGDYSMSTKHAVIRDDLAILSSWKSYLQYRVKITFKENVIAYVGNIGPQKQFASVKDDVYASGGNSFVREVQKAVEYKIGGHKQFVIPRFKGMSDEDGEKYAPITYFARI